jgi:hypothetical protein
MSESMDRLVLELRALRDFVRIADEEQEALDAEAEANGATPDPAPQFVPCHECVGSGEVEHFCDEMGCFDSHMGACDLCDGFGELEATVPFKAADFDPKVARARQRVAVLEQRLYAITTERTA